MTTDPADVMAGPPEWLTDVDRLARNIYYTTCLYDAVNFDRAPAERRRKCIEMAERVAPKVDRLAADLAAAQRDVKRLGEQLDIERAAFEGAGALSDAALAAERAKVRDDAERMLAFLLNSTMDVGERLVAARQVCRAALTGEGAADQPKENR